MKLFALIAALVVSSGNFATANPSIDAKVFKDLADKGTATVILHFKGPKHSDILAAFREEHRPFERSVHHDVLPNILEANANKHQAETLEFLETRKLSKSSGSDYTQIWAVNQIIVRNADAALIEEFKKSNEISRVEAEEIVAYIDATVNGPVYSPPARYLSTNQAEKDLDDPSVNQATPQWGVDNVGAPKVWAKGYNGRGVVVGVIDTGVRPTHEILKANYRLSYGWYDAVAKSGSPYDDHGHGTHCSGTILGKNGYGVAPGATLISCKGLGNTGTNAQLTECGQFMICPTDPYGRNKDCSRKPKVISNSWGSQSPNTFFNNIIDTMVNNGQIVIFSNGNSGRGCGTTGFPADYAWAISVGNMEQGNSIYSGSSRGPSSTGRVKPHVAAPGTDVVSASHDSDTGYVSLTGTSMAAPHVAGIAALLAQANSTFTQQDIINYLAWMAQPTKSVSQTCGGIADTTYPNNQVGYGSVYAPAVFA